MIQEENYIMQNNDDSETHKPIKNFYFLPTTEETAELPFSDYSTFHHGRTRTPSIPAPVSYEEFLTQPTLPSISSISSLSSLTSHSPPWVTTGILPSISSGTLSKTSTPTFDPHESLPSSPFNSEELFKPPSGGDSFNPYDDYVMSHYGHSQLISSNPTFNNNNNNNNININNSNNHLNHINTNVLSNSSPKPVREFSLKNWTKGKLLGSGGFGSVYVGLLETGEIIAVKEIEFAESADDPSSKVLSPSSTSFCIY